MPPRTKPKRFIGLDIHKYFFVATGIDKDQDVVLGPQRVPNEKMKSWIKQNLTKEDALILEMTTNAYEVHDQLVGKVHSVTVVHPPHVTLIARAQVKTDKKDSLILAQLHSAGLIPGVWIPPKEVRSLRALVAQRAKMVSLRSIARCRLHAVLHRHQILKPEGLNLFAEEAVDWWCSLPLLPIELINIQSDLDTLMFADRQVKRLEEQLGIIAVEEERLPYLVQIPGISLINGMTILGAIGDIKRFPSAKKLVGYAGLGARVNQSGTRYRTGRITKTGRKDLRYAMVEAANSAARTHPRWKEEFKRLEPRLGRMKTLIAIARKLLVAVWNILYYEQADRYASPKRVAASLHLLAYRVKVRNLPEKNAAQYVRNQLDQLGIGQDLTHIPWGSKKVKMPNSKLSR